MSTHARMQRWFVALALSLALLGSTLAPLRATPLPQAETVRIDEIIMNAEAYEGETVTVRGEATFVEATSNLVILNSQDRLRIDQIVVLGPGDVLQAIDEGEPVEVTGTVRSFVGDITAELPFELDEQIVDALQARTVILAQEARPLASEGGEQGVLVLSVEPQGPAAMVGLRRSDVITAVDDTVVNTVEELAQAISAYAPGDEVEVTYLRGDDERTATVTLSGTGEQARLGVVPLSANFFDRVPSEMEVIPAPDEEIEEGEADEAPEQSEQGEATDGAEIRSVLEGGPAAESNLVVGDVIVEINGQPVANASALRTLLAELAPGDMALLSVRSSDGEIRPVDVTLAEHPETPGSAFLGIGFGDQAPVPAAPPQDRTDEPAEAQADAQTDEDVVIRIGERSITRAEFDERFGSVLRSLAARENIPLNDQTRRLFAGMQGEYLEQLAIEEALLLEAERRDITLTDEEVQTQLDELRARFEDDAAFQQALTQAGFADEEAFRMFLQRNEILRRVGQSLGDEIQVTEEEVERFYNANRALFRTRSGVMPLAEVQDAIRQRLEQEQLRVRLRELQADAEIEIFPENLQPGGTGEGGGG